MEWRFQKGEQKRRLFSFVAKYVCEVTATAELKMQAMKASFSHISFVGVSTFKRVLVEDKVA